MPELSFFLVPIWEFFIESHNRRQIGMEVSPIQETAIIARLDVRGYTDPGVREFIFDMVCFLDDQWRKITSPTKKKKPPKKAMEEVKNG